MGSASDKTLLTALERIAHIQKFLLWQTAQTLNLTPIQIQILTFLASDGASSRISDMATQFCVAKPTVSDAVATLIKKGLLLKNDDLRDTRSFTMTLTPKGKALEKQSRKWSSAFEKHLSQINNSKKGVATVVLMDLIRGLVEDGTIGSAKMCLNCANFVRNKLVSGEKPHYCRFSKTYISDSEIQFGCKFHNKEKNP